MLAAAVALWLGMGSAMDGQSRPACEMLSVADVERAAGTGVTVDRSQSGPDGNGADFCAWQTPDKHFVILGVTVKASAADAKSAYADWLTQAFGGGPPAQPVLGLGDEAQYRNYVGNLEGGVVVVRKGTAVFSVEGPMGQDGVTALAKLVLARMDS